MINATIVFNALNKSWESAYLLFTHKVHLMLLQCKHISVHSSQRWLLYSLMRSFRKLHCRLCNQNFQSENVTHDFKWWIKLFLNINLTYNSFTLYIILPLTGWNHVLVMYVKENIHPCSCSGAESPVWTENSCILFSSVRHQQLLVIQQHWTRAHTHTQTHTPESINERLSSTFHQSNTADHLPRGSNIPLILKTTTVM